MENPITALRAWFAVALPSRWRGIRADGIDEINLRGVAVDRNGRHGFVLHDCFEDQRVIGCNIIYNATAGLPSRAAVTSSSARTSFGRTRTPSAASTDSTSA